MCLICTAETCRSFEDLRTQFDLRQPGSYLLPVKCPHLIEKAIFHIPGMLFDSILNLPVSVSVYIYIYKTHIYILKSL